MENEFVPYEIAIKLKELGFDEPCVGVYHSRIDATFASSKQEKISFTFRMFQYPKRNSDANTVIGTFIGESGCYAPMYQQVFRWFREMGEDSIVLPSSQFYTPLVYNEKNKSGKKKELYDTYEEAELACLEKLIKIVEQKHEKNYSKTN